MEKEKRNLADLFRETDRFLDSHTDLLWELPAVWLCASFLDSLKVSLVFLAALAVRTLLSLPERFLPKKAVLPYRLVIALSLSLGAAVLCDGLFPEIAAGRFHLLFLGAFCVGILPFKTDGEEKVPVVEALLALLFRSASFVLAYLSFGALREALAFGTLFSGTEGAVSLTEKISLIPMSFFAEVPGGVLLIALLIALRQLLSRLLLTKRKEKTVEDAPEADPGSEESGEAPEAQKAVAEGGETE